MYSMKLFGRKKQKPIIPPELQPYYADRYGSSHRRLWAIIIVIVLILIGLGLVWWFGFHDSSSSDKASNAGTSSQKASPAVQPPQDNKVLKQDNNKPAKTPLTGKTTK